MNPRKLVKRLIPKSLFERIEPYGHLAEAMIRQTLNGFPARNLNIIGVTGTNGKTTTCYLIQRMMHDAGYKVGLMTTVGYGVGADLKPQMEHMTTVSVPLLIKRIKQMKKQGIEWLVLETTSHALAQHRVWGLPYSVAVMTNITHEHLDYHKTFERYRDAKRLLFKQTNANKKGLRLGVINADDPSAKLFMADIANPLLYGIENGDMTAKEVKLTPSGVQFTAVGKDSSLKIKCNLAGSFNVYNSLAAACVGQAIGLRPEQIENGIRALDIVEGRMTKVDEGQPFSVIVDFAHTPDSFQKLFKDIKPVVKGKLIVLFGSAGRRDEAKRSEQGRLAGKYADEIVLTEEDDRDVDGRQILDQIAEGALAEGKTKDKDLFFELDRNKAIKLAFSRAGEGDTVLLLGKGHEKTIERADGIHPWNETEAAREQLRLLSKS